MIKNILIILVLLVLVGYLCFPEKLENFTQGMNLTDPKTKPKTTTEELFEIGVDDKNEPIYQYKNNTFKLGDNDLFQPYEPKKIKYLPVAVKIPSVVTSKSVKSKVPMKMEGYKFRGLVANPFYKQFYVMYEKEYQNYQREDKLYEYLLVKKIEDTFKVAYNVPPRSRVEPGDTIYFSYGNFQIGPLKFV